MKEDRRGYWCRRYREQGCRAVGHCKLSSAQLTAKTARLQKQYEGLLQFLFHDRVVLDFGCGWGRWSAFLASLCEQVYGVDIVERAVRGAKKRVPKGIFTQYDGLWLPFSDAQFGGVFSWTVLQHIPPSCIRQVTGELTRVLAPDGYLVLYENTSIWLEDKEHIWYRGADKYKHLFSPLHCIMVEVVGDVDGTGEEHSLMVFWKEGKRG